MNDFPAPALAKGLDILDLVREHQFLSFSELQELTQDNPSSLNRYIKTLIVKKYLSKNKDQKYILGIKMLGTMSQDVFWPKLIKKCKPEMIKLQEKFGVTCILIGYQGEHLIVLDKAIDPNNLAMMKVGTVKDNHIYELWTNIYYDANLLEKINDLFLFYEYYKLSDQVASDILKLVEFIKVYGYVECYDKKHKVKRLGIPIYDAGQNVIATLGMGTFSSILSDRDYGELKKRMIELGELISKYCVTLQKEKGEDYAAY